MGKRELAGVCFMAIAMLMIPLIDGVAKHLSSNYSPLFISWARFMVAAILVLPISASLFGRGCLPEGRFGSHLFRTALLVGAMSCYFVAISLIPMATAITTYFIAPIVATLMAVSFSGEKLTARKTGALILGLVGTLVIVRPGSSIHYGIYFSLASGVLFGIYLVTTRVTSKITHPIKTLCFQCLVGMILLLPLALKNWSSPNAVDIWLFCLLGVLSACSHFLSIYAFKLAETSVLAPLVYLELLGSVAVGYLVFAEVPTSAVWIGAALITLSGLLVIRGQEQCTELAKTSKAHT